MFSKGLVQVGSGGKKGFVNVRGELVIPCIYRNVGNFSDGLAYVFDESAKYGYIDMTGELVIPFLYEEAINYREGLAPVKFDDKWVLLKRK